MTFDQIWGPLHERLWLGVPLTRWLVFLAVIVGLSIGLKLAASVARRRLGARVDQTAYRIDDYVVRLLERTWTISLVAIATFMALTLVDLRVPATPAENSVEHTIRTVALVVIFLQAGAWASGALDTALQRGFRYANFSETAAQTAYGVVRFFALAAIWMSVVILVMSAFGQPITPLLAGLGVGGIAVAFALQQILGDIFCSVAIVLDRPFEVGDFIISGDFMGTVEHIGVKTTRLRSLGGEQIIIPNADLVGSRVRNYRRMAERRIVFSFGVVYSTSAEVLEKIPGVVKSILGGIQQTRFDRAHFVSFGDSALNFEVVYFVLSPDFNVYMDIQQTLNLALVRELAALGTEMAFPTRTVYLANGADSSRAEVDSSTGIG